MRQILWVLGVSGCCVPPADGLLAAGDWGGDPEPIGLTVREDGTGSLDVICMGGSAVDLFEVTDGAVDIRFSFDPDSWGPDDPQEHDPFEVRLVGTVCGERLTGTATSDDPQFGGPFEVDVVRGRPRGDAGACAE